MKKFNIVTDFGMARPFTITDDKKKLNKINIFIKKHCDEYILFKEYINDYYKCKNIEGELGNWEIYELIERFFSYTGFWLDYRPIIGDKITLQDLASFVKEVHFKNFLLFLLDEEYILESKTGGIIQDEPMTLYDLYLTKDGFLVFFIDWRDAQTNS